MSLTRRASGLLVAVAVWNWIIWLDFARRLVDTDESTSFVVVHVALIAVSLFLGTAVGVIGVRGWRSSRQARVSERALRSFMQSGTSR